MPAQTYPIVEVIQVPDHVLIKDISDYVGFATSELITEAGAGMIVPGSIKHNVISIREYVLQYQRLAPKLITRDHFNEISKNKSDGAVREDTGIQETGKGGAKVLKR